VERQYPYKHIVATFFGCEADLLDKEAFLKTSLLAIDKANMTLVNVPRNPLVYKVDEDIMGGGVSVNALITTSHLTVHSSKDYSAVEFDCATCGPESRPEEAFRMFQDFLKPTKVKIWYKKGIESLGTATSALRLPFPHSFFSKRISIVEMLVGLPSNLVTSSDPVSTDLI
jgi:S-adenosylmethionine/arginine decarboxylase-like enzyme